MKSLGSRELPGTKASSIKSVLVSYNVTQMSYLNARQG